MLKSTIGLQGITYGVLALYHCQTRMIGTKLGELAKT